MAEEVGEGRKGGMKGEDKLTHIMNDLPQAEATASMIQARLLLMMLGYIFISLIAMWM